MSKRLLYLEKVVADGSADSFARYALALEYKSLGRTEDALSAFGALREKDPAYVPMYLMCGTMLIDAARPDEAREWLEQGAACAARVGDGKAASEIADALSRLA